MPRPQGIREAAAAAVAVFSMAACAQEPAHEIPRTWDDDAVASFELPLARPDFSPVHISERDYYELPERRVWKSYPVYHPDHEPEGYREGLAGLEPELLGDETGPSADSEQAWVAMGRHVFHAPIAFDGPTVRPSDVLDPAWYEANGIGITSDGVFPYAQWVIREKGKLEVGNLACAMCHTRLMPDGTVIEGAQGNFPLDLVIANRIRSGGLPLPAVRAFSAAFAAVPWAPEQRFDSMSAEELATIRAAIPAGVMVRQGTAFDAPAKIPDLIGIRDREYLDATGLVRHRGIGDLMRYAAANQMIDLAARFGDFVPATGTSERPEPGRTPLPGLSDRYSDAQLYALSRFLYALEPPPNPNPFDAIAARGEEVFESQGCPVCHTPPLYTSNELIRAEGFTPPGEHFDTYAISRFRVGTDPALALTTRRGTGYYKVPSLKGVWYRGPLEHSGSVATLEEWFDPARLEDDYVPKGFAGTKGARPVPGHLFGLQLGEEDKRALIAFLRTL